MNSLLPIEKKIITYLIRLQDIFLYILVCTTDYIIKYNIFAENVSLFDKIDCLYI